jgi:hypothetical protein
VGRRELLAVLAAAALVIVAVVAFGGGSSDKSSSGTSSAPESTTTSTSAKPKPKPGSAAPRRHRQGVIRGRGTEPDRPAPGTGALLGIADQKAATFSDPTFRRLGVARARLNTPWNSIFTEPGRLNQWLSGARADGVEPLVAFERSRGDLCPAQPCGLPSVANYTKAVSAFHQRYPWVHVLQAWNEANSATQPTGKHPERAAAYYEALKRVCSTCTITAADVLDGSNLERWLTRFKAAVRGTPTPLWGLHNYSDTNRFRDTGTKKMLSLVPGQIWFTEAGGIVSFTTADGRTAFPYNEARAAKAVSYLFRLSRLSPRITRVYIYQWKIDFRGNRFDAGLLNANGRPRPALSVVERQRALLR